MSEKNVKICILISFHYCTRLTHRSFVVNWHYI